MAKDELEGVQDIVLTPPLSDEEKSATEHLVYVMVEDWRRRNRRTYKRAEFNRQRVLLMLGVQDKPTGDWEYRNAMRDLGARNRFRRSP